MSLQYLKEFPFRREYYIFCLPRHKRDEDEAFSEQNILTITTVDGKFFTFILH